MSERIKIDRRVRYTKKAIRESFFALLEQKPVEKISVTEICRGADINRGTFYSHYTDPFDLRRSLADELVQAIEERMHELGVTRLSSIETFKLIRENRELCRVFAGENGDRDALGKIISMHTDAYLNEVLSKVGNLPQTQTDCLRMLLISSITTIVKHWFDTDLEAEPEEVSMILDKYCSRGILGFIEDD